MCLHRVDPSGAVHQVVRERDSLPTTVGAAGQVLRVSSGVRGKKSTRFGAACLPRPSENGT